MALLIQPSFAKGEIGSQLYGRVDTAMYDVALKLARNFIIHPYGGASNRPGQYFIAYCKTHDDMVRKLIRFQFKTTDSYMLEFGDHYMRVIRNDAHVTEPDKAIVSITVANPAVFTVTAHGFANGDEVFLSSVAGMPLLEAQRYVVAGVTTNTFTLLDQVDGTPLSTLGTGPYTGGGTAARVYTLTTPWAAADLRQLKYTQSADVMTLTHNAYDIYELSRLDHDNWTLNALQIGPTVNMPTGITASAVTTGTTTYRYRVTALADADNEESLPGISSTAKAITGITKANPAVVTAASHGFSNGDEVVIDATVNGMVEIRGKRSIISGVTTNTFQLIEIDSTSYSTYASGGSAYDTVLYVTNGNATANNTVSWAIQADAAQYNVYKYSGGAFGLIGTTTATSFTDTNIAPDLTTSPPEAKNPFDAADDKPGAVDYYEQRRVFGGSIRRPDTSIYSQTGHTKNFNVSSPIQDSDAITSTLASRQVNEIRHFVALNDLLVLTSGSEWKVTCGTDSFFGPDTIRQKPQSNWGTSHLIPFVVGNTVIFLEDSQQRVRSLGYDFQTDGYKGSVLNLLAPHLLELNYITDWTFAATPDQRIYAVRDDGQMLTMTFDKDQDVTAWTHFDTRGWYEAVGSLKNPSGIPGVEDGVYFIVKRVLNGRIVRCIEKAATRTIAAVEDCFFVDAGLTYDVPINISLIATGATTTVTATAHGLVNGDAIDFSDIMWEPTVDDLDNETQPDQLNGKRYYVNNATANTFGVVDKNGANINSTTFNPYWFGGRVRKAVTTISGLQHLANEKVSVLSNGDVVSNLTVSATGTLTLPRPASRIHVGLGYICDLQTLNIEAPNGQGTIQGKLKTISTLTVRFEKTRGLFYGPEFDELVEMKQRDDEDWGEPTGLLTGDRGMTNPSEWNSNGILCMRQRYPLPCTVLAVIPDLDVADY